LADGGACPSFFPQVHAIESALRQKRHPVCSTLLDQGSLVLPHLLVHLPDLEIQEHQRHEHAKPLTKLPGDARSESDMMAPPSSIEAGPY